MDLGTISFLPGDRRREERTPVAVLLAMAAARQATSPTALAQARLPVVRVRMAAAFAGEVADTIARWAGAPRRDRGRRG